MVERGRRGAATRGTRPDEALFHQYPALSGRGRRRDHLDGLDVTASGADSRFTAFRSARVTITGGVGLIGSALARRLVDLDAEVLLIDSMIAEYGGNVANIA